MQMQLDLFLPERFDVLERNAKNSLNSIVVPVQEALKYLDDLYDDMHSSGKGAFLVFRGESGSGKSTFLHTLSMFKDGVEVFSITNKQDVGEMLQAFSSTFKNLRVIVIEGREALTDVSEKDLEKTLHQINSFIRAAEGEKTLVVWPCNTDDLETFLISLANKIGADSLLGVSEGSYKFLGPPKDNFLYIASRTIETLNGGASLIDLGVTEDRAKELIDEVPTIGRYLALLRKEIRRSQSNAKQLIDKEQCRLWIVVIAGNDPEKDVAALTRGSYSAADIGGLMISTQANIVEDIKKYPDKIGTLASIFDAKILYLPAVSAIALVKQYADAQLRTEMVNLGISKKADPKVLQRLKDSEIAKSLISQHRGIGRRGNKIGSNSKSLFTKIATIARSNDRLLNQTIGEALKVNKYVDSFDLEVSFKGTTNLRTDLVCHHQKLGVVRMEMMWRDSTSRAEIANYVLTKLYYYGRSIGYLD